MNVGLLRCCFLALTATLFVGCKTASNLLYEPSPSDPLDGYKGSLAQAGINTEMDWGPKQSLLLSEFKTLKEAHTDLERRLEDARAENQNLKMQLSREGAAQQKEKALRAQAEAETEMLRQRRRDLEARILSLSIEKAKVEQDSLVSKIESLKAKIDQSSTSPIEAAATPPPRK